MLVFVYHGFNEITFFFYYMYIFNFRKTIKERKKERKKYLYGSPLAYRKLQNNK